MKFDYKQALYHLISLIVIIAAALGADIITVNACKVNDLLKLNSEVCVKDEVSE